MFEGICKKCPQIAQNLQICCARTLNAWVFLPHRSIVVGVSLHGQRPTFAGKLRPAFAPDNSSANSRSPDIPQWPFHSCHGNNPMLRVCTQSPLPEADVRPGLFPTIAAWPLWFTASSKHPLQENPHEADFSGSCQRSNRQSALD